MRPSFTLSCITPVSLLGKIDPNLGDHSQTRNVENANKNGPTRTRANLRENPIYICKTFIHRFDSDRRLQHPNKLNQNGRRKLFASLGLPQSV